MPISDAEQRVLDAEKVIGAREAEAIGAGERIDAVLQQYHDLARQTLTQAPSYRYLVAGLIGRGEGMAEKAQPNVAQSLREEAAVWRGFLEALPAERTAAAEERRVERAPQEPARLPEVRTEPAEGIRRNAPARAAAPKAQPAAPASPAEKTSTAVPLPTYHRSWGSLRHRGGKSARMHALQRVYGIVVPPVEAPSAPEKAATAPKEPEKSKKDEKEAVADKKEQTEKGGSGEGEKAKKAA